MLLMPDAPPVLPILRGDARPNRATRAALFAGWLLVAGWLAWAHVPWRDEVRAWTLARTGDSVPAMLVAIHGEGHPALWYLLLRAAIALVGAHAALPGLGFALGAGGAALFAWRAPFRPLVIALVLASAFCVHEYAAIARNYGITMLLLFAFAALYPRWKRKGVGLGVLLALLANTNAPAVLLAGGLGLFWGGEIWATDGWRWTRGWRRWVANMGVLLVGVIACAAVVYPPANDAAVSPVAGQLTAGLLIRVLFNWSAPLGALVPESWWFVPFAPLVLAAIFAALPFGLLRAPGGLAAALAAAVGLPLFFQLVYPGGYRHEALYLCFLLTLYWLLSEGGGGRWPLGRAALRPAAQGVLVRAGQGALVALLLAQLALTAQTVAATAGGVPFSRSADLAALLRRDGLGDAVVMSDNDTLLEPLSFQAPNPLWLTRANRWGRVVPFRRTLMGDLSLARLLATAQALHARTGRPVVILMQQPLDPAAPAQHWHQGYQGDLSATPDAVRAFLAQTRLLARLGPAVTDETYAVYRLAGA